MNVKKEENRRRSVQVEIEVAGTPEEVWQAIATGPGISSWLTPAEFEEKDGKPVALRMNFGPGMEPRSEVTAWDPLRTYTTQADGFMPGSPPIATEWSIEAREGGTCTLRIVQSLFASTEVWDDQLGCGQAVFVAFLRTLQIYLTHYRGLRSKLLKWMVPAQGTEAEVWHKLTQILKLDGVKVGQQYTSPDGSPAMSGVVEYVSENPYDLLLRLDKPGPAVAAFGAVNCGDSILIGLNLYLYGDLSAETAAHQMPLWDAWFHKHFPAPTDPIPSV